MLQLIRILDNMTLVDKIFCARTKYISSQYVNKCSDLYVLVQVGDQQSHPKNEKSVDLGSVWYDMSTIVFAYWEF